jgi:twitching motility protein PilI
MSSGFSALLELAERTRIHSLPIPLESDAAPRRSGIGFALLGKRFLVPMSQVAEILDLPTITRLPGVQPWVMGLANVRGRLLPLFDMAHFMGGACLGQLRQRRALVLDTDALYAGLVVDQSFGMQHFTSDLYSDAIPDVPESVLPFVKGSYTDALGVVWALFDMQAIAQNPRFMNAALIERRWA